MYTTINTFAIVSGWTIVIDLPLDFEVEKETPRTMFSPGEPEHVSFVEIDEDKTIELILAEVDEIVRAERVGIAFSCREVLDDLNRLIVDNGYLDERLMKIAKEYSNGY